MRLNKRLIFITLTAALGGFLFGFDTAVIAGATSALEKLFSLDKFWLGFTVSIALIGTIIGTMVVGPMYIAEIAPAKYRGRLVGMFQFNKINL